MDYKLLGDTLPSVALFLNKGEEIYTQIGAMSWMTEGIKMSTSAKGGMIRSVMRKYTGESLFISTFKAIRDGETLNISSGFPGHIIDVELDGDAIIAQKSAFLCAEPNVLLEPHITKKISGGMFGGEGFILQKLSGHGMAFLEIDGDVITLDLQPGEVIKVSTGHVTAFASSVGYSVETVGGVGNTLFGGEGMFLTVLTGPGRVWMQSIPLQKFANSLKPSLGI